jgi:hypothetical protein
VKEVVKKHGDSFIFYDPAQERHNLMKTQRLTKDHLYKKVQGCSWCVWFTSAVAGGLHVPSREAVEFERFRTCGYPVLQLQEPWSLLKVEELDTTIYDPCM